MSRWTELKFELQRNGFYPELLIDSLEVALGGESVNAFVLNHEATFEREEIRRHATVAVVTPSRLIVSHTDEVPAQSNEQISTATTATEAVRLAAIGSVVIQRQVSNPAEYGSSVAVTQEVVITVGWGAVTRLDVGPAACEDANCEAEHGFTGSAVNEDLTIRVSLAAEGQERITQAWEFARALSAASAK